MKKELILKEAPVNKALLQLSIPAMMGIMVMALYNIADTVFVGRLVGTEAIGGLSIVLPITMLISAVGMATGIGGASLVSRYYGATNTLMAKKTFGNLLLITSIFGIITVIIGLVAAKPILIAFGAKGAIFDEALIYFRIVILGAPFLAYSMVGNNIARAEGDSKTAMNAMVFSALLNILLDALFMMVFKMGLAGAAWATFLAQVYSSLYLARYFNSSKSILSLSFKYWKPKGVLIKETISIGSSTFARQSAASVIAAMINHALIHHGGEFYVAIYGLIYRVMMFTFFPMIGIVQGFIPLIGYNFGAREKQRVKATLKSASWMITLVSCVCFIVIMLFPNLIMSSFSTDEKLVKAAADTLKIIGISLPLVGMQMIGASYYQAIGKAAPALFLTLSRQVIFVIPLIYFLPKFYGIHGVFYAIPIADVVSFTTTMVFLIHSWKRLNYDPN
ncbi:MATE family efflux transporter [Persicobacter diffluens]|uniref:Multidrug export protein MepA n=1 Tax=Persicobacter diffluens TaxID=981 RepID=A0AAN5ANM8_9BACT|nr:MATE family efflux transporter [Persicobacter diffluens]